MELLNNRQLDLSTIERVPYSEVKQRSTVLPQYSIATPLLYPHQLHAVDATKSYQGLKLLFQHLCNQLGTLKTSGFTDCSGTFVEY
jgi:hypothetical protein